MQQDMCFKTLSMGLGGTGAMEAHKERGPNEGRGAVGVAEEGREPRSGVCQPGGDDRGEGLSGTTLRFLACATCTPAKKGHRWDKGEAGEACGAFTSLLSPAVRRCSPSLSRH